MAARDGIIVSIGPTVPLPSDPIGDGTLLRVWSSHWDTSPDRHVLIDRMDGPSALSGAALQERTAVAAAAYARNGVGAGDRVLWSCAPSLDSIVGLLGAMRLGATVVPVSPTMTRSELRFVLDDVQPSAALVALPDQRGWIEATPGDIRVLLPNELGPERTGGSDPTLDAARADDDALIVYTSGTTGQPKGAVHTHRSLSAGVQALRLAWGWGPDDRLVLTLPLFHVHGLCAGLFGTLTAGGSATVFDRFSPSVVLDSVADSTMFFGVPTMYHRMAESGRAAELSPLRLCVSGSAPLPADIWTHFRQEGVVILERYGMSETLLTLSNPLEGERRPGTVGLPLPGVEATIAEADDEGIGELMVRGPSLCRGYWQRPEATTSMWRDRWFATGDQASVGDGGYFSIRGRRTELIITGGHNVYPAEVEAVLSRHPSVREIAVVGVDSAEWGESVTAFVVGADGAPDIEGLSALAATELSSYKRPREYRVVDLLPRNVMGKVIRRDLR